MTFSILGAFMPLLDRYQWRGDRKGGERDLGNHKPQQSSLTELLRLMVGVLNPSVTVTPNQLLLAEYSCHRDIADVGWYCVRALFAYTRFYVIMLIVLMLFLLISMLLC